MRRFAALAVGCALAWPASAPAAPFTVDRLLALEKLGEPRLDPTGRLLVVQRYTRWDSAPVWDLDRMTDLTLGQIQLFDLAAGGIERPLKLPAGSGYSALGISPGGKRLAVGRMTGHAYELGVVDLATGEAHWLGVSPRIPQFGPDIVWRNDDEIIVAAVPNDLPDFQIRMSYEGQARLETQWAQHARGELAETVIGSGRYRGLRPKAPVRGLVSVNLKTGEIRTLIKGSIEDFAVAPNGHAVAAMVEGEDVQPVNDGPKTSASPIRFNRLAIIDLDTGRSSVPCQDCEIMNRLLSWSEDGEQLLAFARQGDVPFSAGRFWRFTAKGQAAAVALDALEPVFGHTYDEAGLPLGDWMEGDPVVFARPKGGGRADYWRIAASGPVNLTRDMPEGASALGVSTKVWAVSAGSKMWRMTKDGARDWGVPASKVMSLASAPEGFRGLQNIVPPLYELGLAADAAPTLNWPGRRTPLPLPGARIAGSGSYGTAEVARDSHGVQTVRWVTGSSPPRTLATVNADLADVVFAEPIEIHHKGLDGKDLTSLLYLPPGHETGVQKLPVVVLPYPSSPLTRAGSLAPGAAYFTTNPHLIAAHGFAALVPAMPYLDGREPMDGMADQILGAVDAAAARGLVDPDRIAVWGHSYGGYTAVAAASQTSRFRAVIAGAPTVNLLSGYGTVGPWVNIAPEVGLHVMASAGWHETGQTRMGVPPWKAPELYLRNSPIIYVDKITAPMLILYGDIDKYIDQPQSLFTALYRLNKDAIFVTYRGESHVIVSPANLRDQWRRVFSFLDENLALAGAPVSP